MTRFDPNYYTSAKDDAQMIQSAVDAAAECGEKVIIPRHNERTDEDIWILPRAIKLYTGSTVCLDNCHLRQADGSFDNIFKNSYARTEEGRVLKNRQYDIHIYGLGNALLDGGNHNGLVERNANRDGRPTTIVNCPLHFVNCERIRVEDLRFIHSRYWGMCFHYCSSGRISNIYFMNLSNCPNQDGIDLRTGCHSFVIENISGFTQDDSIALTCLRDGGRYDVDGMDNSIHNVIIRNITTGTRCAQVRLLNNYRRKLYNIIIENVMSYAEYDPCDEKSSSLPLRVPMGEDYYIDSLTTSAMSGEEYWERFSDGTRPNSAVRIGENHYYDPNDPNTMALLGDTYNITVRNIQSRARTPVFIGRTLADSVIENVQAFGDAAVAVYLDGGEYDNIKFRNIGFTRSARHSEKEPCSANPKRTQFKNCSVVYFNNAKATHLTFDGITTAENSPAVFSGDGEVELTVRDIYIRNEETPLILGNVNIEGI